MTSIREILGDQKKIVGVNVSYELYQEVMHEFFGIAAIVPEAKDAQKYTVNKLFRRYDRDF